TASKTSSTYGYTSRLKLKYNGKIYEFKFQVVDLTFNVTMSIGTDLMRVLGIGYHGLDPPVKGVTENPLEDIIASNEALPPGSFCTHPDAVVYLDTPGAAEGYKSQYPIAHNLKPKVQETVKDTQGKCTDKRPCLDPRHINKYLKEDRFLLPKINDIFRKLQDANTHARLQTLCNGQHRALRFLKVVNCFRHDVPKIAALTAPIDGLRKHPGAAHDVAFHKLKQALIHASILQPLNLGLPFQVARDASDVGIGAVLYQEAVSSKKLHYIGLMARALTKSERNYGTTKRELLAIVFALQRFHTYLWG
ncbi:hypothetical protein A0J61_11370, partial [Choanephora cucurbitarum]